ncbi:MAG: nucleotidyltransferase domain-containing protein [Chloroflexi bacterium]|nr:nucleotidyltransferase domain-containing protein [Chloroflexota bacterium]
MIVEEPLLAEAVKRLVDAFAPERIYLFGSRARGDASEDSDYYLFVIVPASDLPHVRRAQVAHLALRDLGAPKDVVVWTREEFERYLPVVTSLPATVAREGRLLYAA